MEDTREVELKDIIKILLKKWWLIVLFTIIGFGTAYFLTDRFVTPIYEAKTVLFIGKEDASLGNVGISLGQINADSQLIIDYKQIALTRLVIDEVIKNLKLDMSYNQLRSNVVIETVQDSRLFTVGFMYPDPKIAKVVSDELAKQLSVAALEIVGVENIRILDQAQVPQSPISPNKTQNAMIGGILGLILALFIIIMMFIFDDTVKNEEDIENLIGASVLGNIPNSGKQRENSEESGLVTLNNPTSFVSESYKLLRTNLNFKNTNNKNQVMLLTSAGKAEGKTTTICNLAITFAQSSKRVLLIDADLRLPRVNKLFKIDSKKPGLSNMLIEGLLLDIVVNKVQKYERLDILSAGNKQVSPTELLNSDAFEQMIMACKKKYDIILIDTPPILSFADSSIITRVVDGVVLVVEAEEAKKAMVVEAKKSLDKVGAALIGVVLTKVEIKNNQDYYEYDRETSKKSLFKRGVKDI